VTCHAEACSGHSIFLHHAGTVLHTPAKLAEPSTTAG
jgi:hypothetical protein